MGTTGRAKAANRVRKTFGAGGYETACHLTGEYPDWWVGRRFDGTGVVPGERLGAVTWKQGISDFADTIKVRHVSGGWSTLGFKSYNQGRGAFQGTSQHGVWLDEEPPMDVYGECLMRTATTNGITMLTFTPLNGMSEVVMSFMPPEMRPGGML